MITNCHRVATTFPLCGAAFYARSFPDGDTNKSKEYCEKEAAAVGYSRHLPTNPDRSVKRSPGRATSENHAPELFGWIPALTS